MVSFHHREFVAGSLRIVSLAVAIPSTLAFLFVAWDCLRLHMMAPVSTDSGGSTGNQLIDLLVGFGRMAGKAFAFMGALGEWALLFFTGLLFMVAAVAWSLFFISRGIHASRPWARILGILFALGALLASLAGLTALRRPLPLTLFTLTATAALYVLWTLVLRFA